MLLPSCHVVLFCFFTLNKPQDALFIIQNARCSKDKQYNTSTMKAKCNIAFNRLYISSNCRQYLDYLWHHIFDILSAKSPEKWTYFYYNKVRYFSIFLYSSDLYFVSWVSSIICKQITKSNETEENVETIQNGTIDLNCISFI